ncbi:MAG: alanine racemase [Minisyncoccia bacterium]
MKAEHDGLRTWVEIDTKAIRANYRTFRKIIPKKVRMLGVVKSNAYGHSIVEYSRELEKLGIDMLAVDSLVEALVIRKSGIKTPVLVLGYTLPELFAKALRKNIHLTISSIEGLKTFLKNPNANIIPIHLKVDTGMHRQGFLLHEIEKALEIIKSNKLNVAGLYTHFASAKDLNERLFTKGQIAEFEIWRSALRLAGFTPMVHASATGGSLYFNEAHYDMVRIGAGLYGFWPDGKIFSTKPVLSWKTIISEIKEIPAGACVGYDFTHKAKKATRIAVCPIGYWHGYPRTLSNNSEVLVRGIRAKVLGRVSMDMIVIDITNIPHVKIGDEAVLIGRSGKEEISANEIAERAGTSAYEILTRLNPLMKRIYK